MKRAAVLVAAVALALSACSSSSEQTSSTPATTLSPSQAAVVGWVALSARQQQIFCQQYEIDAARFRQLYFAVTPNATETQYSALVAILRSDVCKH